MTLAPGARLGPYEIVAAIGAGGMGEVYRARDTRLDRAVALKVLSPAIAGSPEARARFEREARTISQLSNPHICQLFDVGNDNGIAFLVMELLEGETLAARLAKAPLSLSEALAAAAMIADALAVAHRAGIIHRDLKPANVMLVRSGVKLLDFGLAKTGSAVSGGFGPSVAATAAPVTAAGGLTGTVQYMAPEVLAGQAADARSDIYALAAVIYEMVTRQQVFRASLTTLSPPALDRLVKACLSPDPDERWQSARDVALQLRALDGESIRAGASQPSHALRFLPWIVAAVAVAAALVAVVRLASTSAPLASTSVQFEVPPPPGHVFWDNLETVPVAIAPDGSRFGYIATDGHVQRVWLRSMASIGAAPIPGTDGARSLFWSPDGRSIGFFTSGKLKRVDLPNGTPVTICDVPEGIGLDGTWGGSDLVLFAPVTGDAIYRVPASGGAATVERRADMRDERQLHYPHFLPDGRHFVYSTRTSDGDGRVMMAEIGQPGRALLTAVTNAQFADPDYLVYARDGALIGQHLDVDRGEMRGAPFSISDSVRYFYSTGNARFAVSRSGAIVYHAHADVERLAWIDRTGRDVGTLASGRFIAMRISPDGQRVAYSRAEPKIGTFDLWVAETAREGMQRLTSARTSEVSPVWLPDRPELLFAGGIGAPHIVRKSLVDGTEVELMPGSALQYPEDVSRDGRTLVFVERGPTFDIWAVPMDHPTDRRPLLQTPFNEYQPRLSPDGRFFAFVSNESGRNEVYVSAFPPRGLKTPASTAGGTIPRWSRDGRELYFLSSDRRLMKVDVRTAPVLAVGAAETLFPLAGQRIWKDYDVAPDGARFLAVVTDQLGDERPMTVVTNWRPERSP